MWDLTIICIVTKKKKNDKKYYANAKVSSPWHTLNTPSHTSDLDTCVRTKLDYITWSSFKIVCNTKTYIQKCYIMCVIKCSYNQTYNIARYNGRHTTVLKFTLKIYCIPVIFASCTVIFALWHLQTDLPGFEFAQTQLCSKKIKYSDTLEFAQSKICSKTTKAKGTNMIQERIFPVNRQCI